MPAVWVSIFRMYPVSGQSITGCNVCAQFTCANDRANRHIPLGIILYNWTVESYGSSQEMVCCCCCGGWWWGNNVLIYGPVFCAMEIVNNNRHHKQSSRGQSYVYVHLFIVSGGGGGGRKVRAYLIWTRRCRRCSWFAGSWRKISGYVSKRYECNQSAEEPRVFAYHQPQTTPWRTGIQCPNAN